MQQIGHGIAKEDPGSVTKEMKENLDRLEIVREAVQKKANRLNWQLNTQPSKELLIAFGLEKTFWQKVVDFGIEWGPTIYKAAGVLLAL